ncbi:glutamyl-tRNA reductase [Vallicoccus soli]|uniref:Glutamyl-tRNA reductase n=1 Tax=Vallicoccus soli TaxID=2339232 RepID=A0A3A3ZJZ5_9ACTN|nr:glutamyl-tRNA reductase [Vallicoccus soli]RJK96083.1 glutamyl-tRNA reductase [Vallicoccus soli]
MSVLAVGLSHRTAPVSALERAALDPAAATALAAALVGSEFVGEAFVLSTCNRIEVYADVEKFHGGVGAVSERLAAATGLELDALMPHLYVHYEDRAVEHLFRVACGLDSMVVGEGQVLGQIKQSLRRAQDAGAVGRVLNELVQHALRVGKRAHAETAIDRAGQSLVTVGLELAEQALGDLAGRRALVVGAGSMAALSAVTMHRRGFGEVVVLNRTPENAERLAATVEGRSGGLDALPAELAAADVVVSCTGAIGAVVGAAQVREAQRARGGAPLVLLDLALPRDVDAAAREVEGVRLVDLEHLADVLRGTSTADDLDAVRGIVADEVTAFCGWQRAASVAPTVVALRSMASEVVDAELSRLAGRVPALDERARAEVAQTVRRVVDKLLHAPTVRVKELAGEPGGHAYADALRQLFDLDPRTVEAVPGTAIAGDLPDPARAGA